MANKVDKFVLRRLYNPENAGRGEEGKETRSRLHTTITHMTWLGLANLVPMKKGGYAAPVVELAIRVILAVIGNIKLEAVAEELALACTQRSEVVANLRKMADLVQEYKPVE